MLFMVHWLLYINYLYILYYLQLQLWHCRRSRIQKQPPEMFLKNTCVGVSFLQSCKPSGLQRYYKETPTQVLSCEIWEILKNIYFEEHLWTTTSVYWLLYHILIYTIHYSTRFWLVPQATNFWFRRVSHAWVLAREQRWI